MTNFLFKINNGKKTKKPKPVVAPKPVVHKPVAAPKPPARQLSKFEQLFKGLPVEFIPNLKNA